MDVRKLIGELEETSQFKDWKKEHPDAYLAHAFVSLGTESPKEADIGYYDKGSELMRSFLMDLDSGKVVDARDDKVFKEPGKEINGLVKEDILIDLDECLDKVNDLQIKQYKQHVPVKKVVILQNIKAGQVWNVTYITSTLKTLNVKVDAKNGVVVEEGLHAIMEFK